MPITKYLQNGALKYLAEKGVTDDELPKDLWEIVTLRFNIKANSGWSGFVRDSSEIRIQIKKDKHEVDRMPGEQFWLIGGRAQYGRGHYGVPPISLEEMIKKKGEVLIADAILFIAHDESLSGEIYPYFIRYWLDPINNIWRPHKAVSFPKQGLNYHFEHTIAY